MDKNRSDELRNKAHILITKTDIKCKYTVNVKLNNNYDILNFIIISSSEIKQKAKDIIDMQEGQTFVPVALQRNICSFIKDKYSVKVEQVLEVENED